MTELSPQNDGNPPVSTNDPIDIVRSAIARRVCITAVYNNGPVRLSPLILYTKHDELYVDAVTVERDGIKPKETKIGAFKLVGLGALEITRSIFIPFRSFNADDPKYAENTLCSVLN